MHEFQKSPTGIPRTDQNPILRFLEPAMIITALTAELYLIGYTSVGSFFTRLGYDHLSLDLPPNYYISLSIQPIIIFFFTIASAYMAQNSSWRQHRRFVCFVWQIPLLLMGGVFTYEAAKHFPSPSSYPWAAFAFLVLMIVGLFLWRSWNLLDFMLHADLQSRIIMLVMFFVFSFLFAGAWGELTATRLIEGDPAGYINIDFTWKNLPPPELQGKDLVLVLHRDGKYLVVAHEKPASEHPKFYMIPDDQVDLATTRLATNP